jgi:hypothetical protein
MSETLDPVALFRQSHVGPCPRVGSTIRLDQSASRGTELDE